MPQIEAAALVVKTTQVIRGAAPLIRESPHSWPYGSADGTLSAADDLDRTPSPRTFLAIFGANGALLTIDNSRFAFMKFAVDALRNYDDWQTCLNHSSITSHFLDRSYEPVALPRAAHAETAVVHIRRPAAMFECITRLARQYRLGQGGEIVEDCRHNACVAQSEGCVAVARMWAVVAEMLQAQLKDNANDGTAAEAFAMSGFGCALAQSTLDHYIGLGDTQTSAMLICVFRIAALSQVHSIGTRANLRTRIDDGSGSGSVADGRAAATDVVGLAIGRHRQAHAALLPADWRHDAILLQYISMLERWSLLEISTRVSKLLRGELMVVPSVRPFDQVIACRRRGCGEAYRQLQGRMHCTKCNWPNVNSCAICNLPVTKLLFVCTRCGHGGHMHHIADWFKKHRTCPSGCGCSCLSA